MGAFIIKLICTYHFGQRNCLGVPPNLGNLILILGNLGRVISGQCSLNILVDRVSLYSPAGTSTIFPGIAVPSTLVSILGVTVVLVSLNRSNDFQ